MLPQSQNHNELSPITDRGRDTIIIIVCIYNNNNSVMSAERKIEVSAEQRLKMNLVNGSDGRCIVAVCLINATALGSRIPLHAVLLQVNDNTMGASLPCLLNYPNFRYIYIYIYIFQAARLARAVNALRANVGPAG